MPQYRRTIVGYCHIITLLYQDNATVPHFKNLLCHSTTRLQWEIPPLTQYYSRTMPQYHSTIKVHCKSITLQQQVFATKPQYCSRLLPHYHSNIEEICQRNTVLYQDIATVPHYQCRTIPHYHSNVVGNATELQYDITTVPQ